MIEKIFRDIKGDPVFLAVFNEGMSLLYRTRIFEFLRERGRAQAVEHGQDPQAMAYQAARSIGYNQAIEDLFYFREKFLDPSNSVDNVKIDFGGSENAVASGDLTKEELDAIQSGRSYKPTVTRITPKPVVSGTGGK